MITVKSPREIESLRKAGRISALALRAGGQAVRPGITTAELDAIVRRVIESHGATASFLGYRGYPATVNASVNEVVIHGIPGRYRLAEGDIISLDVGACFEGYHGDNAATFAVGQCSGEALRLIEGTKACFAAGLQQAVAGARVSDISRAVEAKAAEYGYGVLREFTGHGIGQRLHEDPEVPNFWDGQNRGARLLPGMTICIEPMITLGRPDITILKDGWTVVTKDKSLSAHHEHTVLITSGAPELLTQLEN